MSVAVRARGGLKIQRQPGGMGHAQLFTRDPWALPPEVQVTTVPLTGLGCCQQYGRQAQACARAHAAVSLHESTRAYTDTRQKSVRLHSRRRRYVFARIVRAPQEVSRLHRADICIAHRCASSAVRNTSRAIFLSIPLRSCGVAYATTGKRGKRQGKRRSVWNPAGQGCLCGIRA